MHPHILIFMAFLSGIILTLYHGVRLIPIRMDPERPRRPFLSSLLLFCFIAILFFGFLYWTTLHTAVEVPLTLAAPDEQYLEGWLMLPPGSYWGALVIPQEAQPTSATAGHALAKDFYDLDYSVSINGKVADREIGTKSVNRGEQQFSIGMRTLVRSRSALVHVLLRVKPLHKGEHLLPMRFVMQSLDEFRMWRHGFSIADDLAPPGGNWRETGDATHISER